MAGSTVFQPGRSFALRGRLVIRPSGQGKALGGLTAQDTSTIVLGRQQQHPVGGGGALTDAWLWETGYVLEWETGIYIQTE